MITLNDYITAAIHGKRDRVSDEETARRLGIDMKELKMWEEEVRDDMKRLIVDERYSVWGAAEILGVPKGKLRNYSCYYGISISPGKELIRQGRKFGEAGVGNGIDIALLEIEVKMPQERDSDKMKCLERQKARKAEEERLMAWRQGRREIKDEIEDCISKGIRARRAIAKELGVSLSTVYYISKGDRRIIGRAEYSCELIRDAIRGGARYKDEIAEVTGLCEQTVGGLDNKFRLGVKRRKQYQDYKSYVTNEKERHRRKPELIRRDYLIGRGLGLREISEIEGTSEQAIQIYIVKTGQHKKWREARERRDIIEDGGLIGAIRLED